MEDGKQLELDFEKHSAKITLKESLSILKIEIKSGISDSLDTVRREIRKIEESHGIKLRHEIIKEILEMYRTEGLEALEKGALIGAENFAKIRDEKGMNEKLKSMKRFAWQRGIRHRIKAVGTVRKVREHFHQKERDEEKITIN